MVRVSGSISVIVNFFAPFFLVLFSNFTFISFSLLPFSSSSSVLLWTRKGQGLLQRLLLGFTRRVLSTGMFDMEECFAILHLNCPSCSCKLESVFSPNLEYESKLYFYIYCSFLKAYKMKVMVGYLSTNEKN